MLVGTAFLPKIQKGMDSFPAYRRLLGRPPASNRKSRDAVVLAGGCMSWPSAAAGGVAVGAAMALGGLELIFEADGTTAAGSTCSDSRLLSLLLGSNWAGMSSTAPTVLLSAAGCDLAS